MEMITKGSRKFDAVFMDLHMPVCDGWQASTILRTRLQAQCPPIYALTGSVLEEGEEKTMAQDLFAGVILKPYSLKQLKDTLSEVAQQQKGVQSL